MYDDQHDKGFHHADGVPAYFAAYDSLNKNHVVRIVKNPLGRLEVDTVLGLVGFVFRRVPFDPHRTYILVNTAP